MRQLRCFLPGEQHFLGGRTVNEEFALHPYAPPGCWPKLQAVHRLSRKERRALLREGRRCVEKTRKLTELVAFHEDQGTKPPPIAIHDFPNSIPNIFGAVLAKAVERSEVELLCAIAMSNHHHILPRDGKGNLALFNEYFHGQLARQVNIFLDRRYALWGRRMSTKRVLGAKAEFERALYILSNPLSANLVARADQWPGFNCFESFVTGKPMRFLCMDRTRWHRNKRPKNIAPYLSTVTLELAAPSGDGIGTMDKRQWQKRVVETVVAREQTLHIERQKTGKKVLGLEGLLETLPSDRPKQPKNSPGPMVHSHCPITRKVYTRNFRLFEQQTREAMRRYMKGEIDVIFPPGAQVPGRFPRPRYPDDPDRAPLVHLSRINIALEVEAIRQFR
ncbi:MAG: hypothetical protein OEZ06_27045 [Myxococcales bacterium]|nr:hypothetical protein [Myxococcales bacterium]